MMAKVGIHVAQLSDKSIKSLAVTKAGDDERDDYGQRQGARTLEDKRPCLDHKEDFAGMIPI
jgi:hypothetical protein